MISADFDPSYSHGDRTKAPLTDNISEAGVVMEIVVMETGAERHSRTIPMLTHTAQSRSVVIATIPTVLWREITLDKYNSESKVNFM